MPAIVLNGVHATLCPPYISLRSSHMDIPIWTPQHPELTNMYAFMEFVSKKRNLQFKNYQDLHTFSITHIGDFWEDLCVFFSVPFHQLPRSIIEPYLNRFGAHWFQGATLNVAQALLSHEDMNHIAVVTYNERGDITRWTYAELERVVSQCAAALSDFGVQPGDRVVGVLSNNIYAVIGMLASAAIGAIWSACSPDFGIDAIVGRFSQISPKVLWIEDGYQYLGKTHTHEKTIPYLGVSLETVEKIIVCPTMEMQFPESEGSKLVYWDNLVDKYPPRSMVYDAFPFDHPWYILYSSGTTGKPKCMVHGTGNTLIQHMKELGLHTNITPKDNLLFYTTCSWMMWNWMVSTLALGATITLYDGSPAYPHVSKMFEVIEQTKVTIWGTSAKFLSVLEQVGYEPKKRHNIEHLKTILSTGSPLLPNQYDFVDTHIGSHVQLSSISGGSDIISCFALGNPILPVYKGELQCVGLGMDVAVFDESGQPIENQKGELVCRKPFPSMPLYFWGDKDNQVYMQTYFQRYPMVWWHGDFASITEHHGLIIYGRSDTTLNPQGIRIGSAEIYQPLTHIPEIQDAVVVGVPYEGDVKLILFVVLQPTLELNDELKKLIARTIKQEASPRHVPHAIFQVPDIPRTLNGKVAEKAVQLTVLGQSIPNAEVLLNPESCDAFKGMLERLGWANKAMGC